MQILDARHLDDGDVHLATLTVLVSLHSHRFRYSAGHHALSEFMLVKQPVVFQVDPFLAEWAVRLISDAVKERRIRVNIFT